MKLVHYDPSREELTGSQKDKAEKFISLDLVERVTDFDFFIKPIKGYNKTTYQVKVVKTVLGGVAFRCNCQFYHTTEKTCSHIMAVKMFMFEKLGGKRQ